MTKTESDTFAIKILNIEALNIAKIEKWFNEWSDLFEDNQTTWCTR